jgi:urea transport system ATP-binding protein
MRLGLEDVAVSYGAVEAVRGVSLVARPGEITCLMGRNGVGKTTLLRAITGLLQPDRGHVRLDDHDITALKSYRRARAGIGFVPQGRQIFPKLTVEENLRIGLAARGHVGGPIPEAVYEMFPVLKEMAARRGGDLSGGQQQQLAIARALVGAPKVLLLDEPTEGIQPNVIQQIGEVLARLRDEMGMTILLVEQYLDFVRAFGQSYYILSRGRVVGSGAPAELSDAIVQEHLSV